MTHLPPHRLALALIHPQIAPNTGNVARLCVATGTPLHLVRPLGFVLSDRNLRRSAMDYWPRLNLTVHDDLPAFLAAITDRPAQVEFPPKAHGRPPVGSHAENLTRANRLWLFDSAGQTPLWQADFRDGDILAFGSETHGIDQQFLSQHPDRTVRIPQVQGERCLNLSTAAGIALYEALRRVQPST
jgi:tRNA (cytidine/uridine-2'-O-)-methyltransferase